MKSEITSPVEYIGIQSQGFFFLQGQGWPPDDHDRQGKQRISVGALSDQQAILHLSIRLARNPF